MKDIPPRQPHYHPDSTPVQRAVALVKCVALASLYSLLPYRASAENRIASKALATYQQAALDRAALRAEIAAESPRSPLYRLQRAARRLAALVADAEAFPLGSPQWKKRATRSYFGTILVLLVTREILEHPQSLIQLSVASFEAYRNFILL